MKETTLTLCGLIGFSPQKRTSTIHQPEEVTIGFWRGFEMSALWDFNFQAKFLVGLIPRATHSELCFKILPASCFFNFLVFKTNCLGLPQWLIINLLKTEVRWLTFVLAVDLNEKALTVQDTSVWRSHLSSVYVRVVWRLVRRWT